MRTSGSHMPARAATSLRADAARNREQLLKAARAAFTEHGPDVPLIDVARRAGVGTATLYRRFPTREALLAAVVEEHTAECARRAAAALAHPEPWTAFCELVEYLARTQVEDRLFTLTVLGQSAATAPVESSRRAVERDLAILATRAQEAGELREDFDPTDITMLLLGVAGITDAMPGAERGAVAGRLTAYVLESFRARPERGPLPAPAALDLRLLYTR
jgi:AcrR family transcriptional regulator